MSINPNLAIWLNIAYAVIAALSIPTLNALGFAASSERILAWAGVIGVIINAVLHAYSSSLPGPLAPPDTPRVKMAMAQDAAYGLSPKNGK